MKARAKCWPGQRCEASSEICRRHSARAPRSSPSSARASSRRELVAPKRLLVQVLANLVRNAFDAQAEAGKTEPVRVVTRLEAERAAFEVFDAGAGIPADASEPRG